MVARDRNNTSRGKRVGLGFKSIAMHLYEKEHQRRLFIHRDVRAAEKIKTPRCMANAIKNTVFFLAESIDAFF